MDKHKRPDTKSKLELNSKKVELEWLKTFFVLFLSFFFALKARPQILKFEFVRLS